ncbi:class I adenylate-forming enzyme family protein [Mycobacterium sp. 050134]|uniref:class I adenylate-forming enzyme family protein n=1 Tax=Mycobacterium sp. 050134 TaxID=3096111 RepID=UPI002ED84C8E
MTENGGNSAPLTLADLGPGAEERQGLSYLKRTDAAELTRETVGQTLLRTAAERPDKPALLCLTERGVAAMSWSELLTAASAAAHELTRINPTRARVVVVGGNSTDWIVAVYGASLAAMPVVPLSPATTVDEIAAVLGDFTGGAILVDDRSGDHVLRDRSIEACASAGCDAVVRPIGDWPPTADATFCEPSPAADEFLVQYTSGTTGRPKPASLSHVAALNAARLFAEGAGGVTGDVWLNPLPLYHVGGLVSGLLSCLSISGTYIVIERFSAEVALRAVREAHPSFVGMVPTMLIDLLDQPGVAPSDFASVRTVFGGATDVDPRLIAEVEDRLGVRFNVGYGQSESPCMAMTWSTDSAEVRTSSLGHPLPGRDYCLVDSEGLVLPVGQAGELCVRGPLNMSGYLQPGGTLDPDTSGAGWRRTGDICVLDDSGILRIRGRSREVIIRGGINIYPAEVEQRLSAHPAVREVAVFGVPDRRLGQKVVAAVLPAVGATVKPADLAVFAEDTLSPSKRPARWLVLEEFPRTASGKVQKHVLQQLLTERSASLDEGDEF